jgi:bifunctional oligoribonuclease and PAP phosphatase NrnA
MTRKRASLDLEPVRAFVERHQRFILSGHETPDADAIGSEYAMLKGLQALGKTACVFNADPAPRKFTFVDAGGEIRTLRDPSDLPADLEQYAFILLDSNDTRNIGAIAQLVIPRVREMLIIDHHESEEPPAGPNIILRGASSTCEIVYQFLVSAGVEITLDVAQALFMGIVFDTGSFIYPKTTALTFEVARDLAAKGVEPNFVYSKLYESNTVGSLVLQASVGATLELHFDNRVAVQTMFKEMISAANARYEDADQVINTPLKSEDVRVSVFFKENLEGVVRCSMRSKGSIDVAEIAQSYGGGGHKTAAGFKCRSPLAQVKRELLERLKAGLA